MLIFEVTGPKLRASEMVQLAIDFERTSGELLLFRVPDQSLKAKVEAESPQILVDHHDDYHAGSLDGVATVSGDHSFDEWRYLFAALCVASPAEIEPADDEGAADPDQLLAEGRPPEPGADSQQAASDQTGVTPLAHPSQTEDE